MSLRLYVKDSDPFNDMTLEFDNHLEMADYAAKCISHGYAEVRAVSDEIPGCGYCIVGLKKIPKGSMKEGFLFCPKCGKDLR